MSKTSEQKLDFEAVCVHCRLPLEKVAADSGKDWRHTGSGSIFCKKKRGMTLMEATPRQRPESAYFEASRSPEAAPEGKPEVVRENLEDLMRDTTDAMSGESTMIKIVRPTSNELWDSLQSFLNSLHRGACSKDSPEGLDHAQFAVMALRPKDTKPLAPDSGKGDAFETFWLSPVNDERRRSKHAGAYKGASRKAWHAALDSKPVVK